MQLNKALNVLNLQAGSYLEDAKEAFRLNAKKYHPDRFIFDENLRKQAEETMKDINLAYQLLSKRLKPRPAFKKEKIILKEQNISHKNESCNDQEQEREGSWIKKFFEKASRFDFSKTRTTSKKTDNLNKKPKYNNFSKQAPASFRKELNKAYNKKKFGTDKKFNSNYSYANYLKLKSKMKTGSRRADFFLRPVEKISPIEPVQPIGR